MKTSPRLLTAVALALACGAAARAQQRQPSAAARQLVSRGTTQMSQNKVAAAIESYTQAIGLSPDYAEAYVKRGMARRAAGDLEGSIADYERATSLDPKSTAGDRFVAESYYNRGQRRLSAFEVEAAVADFTRAAGFSPKDAKVYHQRGVARLVSEDAEGAVADLDRALELAAPADTPLRAILHVDRGAARLMLGREAEAQADFDAFMKLSREGRDAVERHLRVVSMRVMMQRRKRAERQRGVARRRPSLVTHPSST